MAADLDSKIELKRLRGITRKNVDFDDDFDDVFLELYEQIFLEGKDIKEKPAAYTLTGSSVKRKDKKVTISVSSILSDDNETFVKNVYNRILGREPDQEGFNNLIGNLKANPDTDREEIIYSFWKSDEGQKKNIEVIGFHKIHLNDLLQYERSEFIENCYLQILGRKPSSNEIQIYCGAMDSYSMTKEQIVRFIKDSTEGKSKNIQIIGMAENSRKYQIKQSLFSVPVLGNLCLTFWNLLHFNRIIKDVNSRLYILQETEKSDDEKMTLFVEGKIQSLAAKEEKKYVQIIAEREKKYLELCAEIEKLKEKTEEVKNLRESVSKEAEILEETRERLGREEAKSDELKAGYNRLVNPEAETEYLERMNRLLSVRKTLWGPEERLKISPRATVSSCFFNTNSGTITIGDYTFAGSNVSILAGSHDRNLTGLLRRDAAEEEGFDITIGNGVWLGSGSTILGPATIGDNAVIAAGAVVVPGTVIPANTVYGGVPAKQIGSEIEPLKDYSESVMRALERKNGILFTDGWSEEKTLVYEGRGIAGHYILDSSCRVLIEPGEYKVIYSNESGDGVNLIVNANGKNEEHLLSGKEGKFDLNVQSEKCTYISFTVSTEKQIGISIIKN